MPSANAQELAPPQVISNGPQASRGDFGDWSARRNVIQSERYDRLLEASPAFRARRARLECGPITLPDLRDRCLASFQEYEPTTRMYGSTVPPQQPTYGTSSTAGYGGGYATAPAAPPGSTLGAGSSEAYHTPTPGVGYAPPPAPRAMPPAPAPTPGLSGLPY